MGFEFGAASAVTEHDIVSDGLAIVSEAFSEVKGMLIGITFTLGIAAMVIRSGLNNQRRISDAIHRAKYGEE